MIPETLVLALAAYYIGSAVNFSGNRLTTLKKEDTTVRGRVVHLISGAILCCAGIFDIVSIFKTLQNAETGEFDITGIVNTNWIAIAVVTAVAVLISIALVLIQHTAGRKVQN